MRIGHLKSIGLDIFGSPLILIDLPISGIIDDIRHEFNGNNAMMGLLQTAFVIAYMIFAPLFGYLGDRYSRRVIMATGVFFWCVFTVLGSFAEGPDTEEPRGEPSWDNPGYWKFLACRAMVGIGEASYSTIAPTIISDMFVKNMRSQMLAVFYFAIPVGSGLGYIVGAETAKATGSWHWGLRVTPIAGVVAVILILLVMIDPPRGESEGHQDLKAQSYKVWFSLITFYSLSCCQVSLSKNLNCPTLVSMWATEA